MSDDVVRFEALRLRAEIRHDSVSQDSRRYCSDIIATYVISALQRRASFAGQYQILASARSGAPAYEITHHLGHVSMTHSRSPRQLNGITGQVIRNRNATHNVRQLKHLSRGKG